jgi:hypothetical protein
MEPLIYALAGLATGILPLIARSDSVQKLLRKLDDRGDDLSEAATRESETASPPPSR